MINPMAHLNYETLLNYLESQTSAEEHQEVEAHLGEPCQKCVRHLELLKQVLQTASHDRTVAPPADILRKAVELSLSHRDPSHGGFLANVIATLSFDSFLQLSPSATRGSSRARQMLFTTEQVDIDLKIKRGKEEHELLGQVLGTQHAEETIPAFVSLQSNNGQPLKATETDSQGQFIFREIPSGTYDLVFDLDDRQVTVQGLELRNE
jgi:hypothetical protein